MMQFLAQLLALISGKVFKCMRLGGTYAVLALGCAHSGLAWADHAPALNISKADHTRLKGGAHFWHEKPAKFNIRDAAAAALASRYQPLTEETMIDLQPQNALWVRLDLVNLSEKREYFVVWLPLPLIDRVALHRLDEEGAWRTETAGDRVAVATWPEPGRYPRFRVELPPGASSVYLQIQGSTPISLPLHIGSEVPAQAAERDGYLGLGLVIGVLATLILMCFVTAYTYRDRLYLLYGLYMFVMILAASAYTGLAGHLLWNHSANWADAAQGVLAMLTAGGALYFIEAMLGGRRFARRMSISLLAMGALCLPLALVYYVVPRSVGVIILGIYMLVASITGLALALRAWRLGDQVGKWVMLAYLPLSCAVLVAVARAYGWLAVSWVVQYGVVVALLIEAPMMMVALHVRSRQRHEMTTREQALATQDALTGLLKEYIFDDRVRQTLARALKRKEEAAVVLISLVNYEAIVAVYGLPVAEQSVLRAVIKLRKVLRDVDTVARVGTANFGLILEGVSHRSRVTELGARLIAQGLMPLPGLVPEVTLQFHMVSAVMRELPGTHMDIKGDLLALLGTMSRRTRRPIRFLEALTTGGSPLAAAPSRPTAVDVLAQQIAQAMPSGLAAVPASQKIADSSGSNWVSTGQSEPSIRGNDTVAQTR